MLACSTDFMAFFWNWVKGQEISINLHSSPLVLMLEVFDFAFKLQIGCIINHNAWDFFALKKSTWDFLDLVIYSDILYVQSILLIVPCHYLLYFISIWNIITASCIICYWGTKKYLCSPCAKEQVLAGFHFQSRIIIE